jgi:hypothetical protein
MSRSPRSYFISSSSRAHSVSRSVPARIVARSDERRPIQRRPEITRSLSAEVGNETSSAMREIRVLRGSKMVRRYGRIQLDCSRFLGILRPHCSLRDLCPCQPLLQPFFLSLIQETHAH